MKILDISVSVDRNSPVWPGDPAVVLERYMAMADGDVANVSRLVCSVHTGTHVDAPVHFIEGGSAVEQLSLDVLIGPAVVAELPEALAIKRSDLEGLALAPGTKRLLIKTSNSVLWQDGQSEFHEDFVALTPEAASWIVERQLELIGVDYLSVQRFADAEPVTHRTLLASGVVIVEGLDLSGVEPGSYQLICLPMKLVGSDGAPARAVLMSG